MWKYARNLVKQAEGIIAPEPIDTSQPSFGFRVLYVNPDSAGHRAGLESLFDYIVGVNGQSLEEQPLTGPVTVQQQSAPLDALADALLSQDTASLTVWSAKGKSTRTISLPVVENYAAPSKSSQSLDSRYILDLGFGITLQWTPLDVADSIWHVLNVTPGSPADEAGLISHADYIVGAEEGLLEHGGESLLSRVVTRVASDPSRDGSVNLMVYNHDYDTLRPVRIVPKTDEHGNKLMGCGVGYGLLHRLPAVEKHHSNAAGAEGTGAWIMPPGSSLYDEDGSGGSIIEQGNDSVNAHAPYPTLGGAAPIPSSVGSLASVDLAAPPPPRGKARKKPNTTITGDLSAYFDEQTAISREADGYRPSSTVTAVPPPPTKH